MAEPRCRSCFLRARYDKKPQSWLGRLWKWHANWCPGWKSYLKSLPDQERKALAEKYDLPKFR
jgi:hypothetical protein|uniref:Uncharacterized protein n=1 Tax=Desulfobacca acetoxidans TaxID=60893 RepID=A0A7C3Z3S0_9BACT